MVMVKEKKIRKPKVQKLVTTDKPMKLILNGVAVVGILPAGSTLTLMEHEEQISSCGGCGGCPAPCDNEQV